MGGLGSGRYSGCGKATVEDGLTLDINKLVRDLLHPTMTSGASAVHHWSHMSSDQGLRFGNSQG